MKPQLQEYEMPNLKDHSPVFTDAKVVVANIDEVIAVSMCTCKDDYCSWTYTPSGWIWQPNEK